MIERRLISFVIVLGRHYNDFDGSIVDFEPDASTSSMLNMRSMITLCIIGPAAEDSSTAFGRA
jgi:hypothetical protein